VVLKPQNYFGKYFIQYNVGGIKLYVPIPLWASSFLIRTAGCYNNNMLATIGYMTRRIDCATRDNKIIILL